MKLKKYELNVKNMDSSSSKLIKYLCTENVPKYRGRKCKTRIKKHDLIKVFKLARTSISPEC